MRETFQRLVKQIWKGNLHKEKKALEFHTPSAKFVFHFFVLQSHRFTARAGDDRSSYSEAGSSTNYRLDRVGCIRKASNCESAGFNQAFCQRAKSSQETSLLLLSDGLAGKHRILRGLDFKLSSQVRVGLVNTHCTLRWKIQTYLLQSRV